MTKKEARLLCSLFHESDLRLPGYSGAMDDRWVVKLKAAFPSLDWRIFLDCSGDSPRWVITIDNPDNREISPIESEKSEHGQLRSR